MQPFHEAIHHDANNPYSFNYSETKQYSFAWHVHQSYELTIMAKGHGQRFIGERIDEYQAGDIVLIGPNLPHTWVSDKDSSENAAYVLQFSRESFLGHASGTPYAKSLNTLLDSAVNGLDFTSVLSINELNVTAIKDAKNLEEYGLILGLLGHCAQIASQAEIISSRQHQLADPRIDRVCRFAHEEFAKPISTRDAAILCRMSPQSFSRFFKHHSGHTFVDYLHHIRIRAACVQLRQEHYSIAQIALSCGFSNLSHFNRTFKKIMRQTPRHYRQSIIEALQS